MSTLEVDIIAGGDPGPSGRAAIALAIGRTLGARDTGRVIRASAWARAGRLEAITDVRIRSMALLPPR